MFFKNNKVYKCFFIITIVMEFDTPLWRVLDYFFNYPYEEIHLRALSRKTDVSIYSVKHIVDKLVKKNMI